MSELLRAIRVHSTVYCMSDLGAPWGFHVDDSTAAKFHVVLEGACELILDSGERTEAAGGDVVLLASGAGHTMRDAPGSPVRDLDRILADNLVDDDVRLRYGGDGIRTRLVCGGFQLVDALPVGLLTLMPPVVRLDAGVTALNRWLRPLFDLLRDEADEQSPGAAAVFTKLADVFLAQALRSFLIGATDAGLVEVAPLGDPAIAEAVRLLRTRPHDHWSVAELARSVGMSRTLFSARFREATGQTPIRYLTMVRLSRAAGYLSTTDHSVQAIARRSGYDSEASLSKAFKREYGQSPGEYRRRSANEPVIIEQIGERGPNPPPSLSAADAR